MCDPQECCCEKRDVNPKWQPRNCCDGRLIAKLWFWCQIQVKWGEGNTNSTELSLLKFLQLAYHFLAGFHIFSQQHSWRPHTVFAAGLFWIRYTITVTILMVHIYLYSYLLMLRIVANKPRGIFCIGYFFPADGSHNVLANWV